MLLQMLPALRGPPPSQPRARPPVHQTTSTPSRSSSRIAQHAHSDAPRNAGADGDGDGDGPNADDGDDNPEGGVSGHHIDNAAAPRRRRGRPSKAHPHSRSPPHPHPHADDHTPTRQSH